MPVFSEEQVLALASDEGSVKAGRELASARKWVTLGRADAGLWGECQGSGKNPYQTAIDFSGPAFKCSCPSRKFPCKHGLGLLILFAREANSFPASEMPEWVAGWLAGRSEKAEKKAKKEDDDSAKTPDPEAKAKRQADRASKVEAGIKDLDRWIQDRIRQGLSSLSTSNPQLFEMQAARLTDAQAPGLARMLRQCADIPNSHENWPDHLLNRFSLLHLATQGFSRLPELDENRQHDVKSIIGFTVSQEELLKGDGVRDHWQVVGQRVEVDDRLKTQRTWLRGTKTRQWALILQFAHGSTPLDISFVTAHSLDAELVFFPGTVKMRALAKSIGEGREPIRSLDGYATANEFLLDYAKAIALNPWTETFPCAIKNVVPTAVSETEIVLVDSEKNILPMRAGGYSGWQLLASSGGRAIDVFGEWSGRTLLPLGIFREAANT